MVIQMARAMYFELRISDPEIPDGRLPSNTRNNFHASFGAKTSAESSYGCTRIRFAYDPTDQYDLNADNL